MASVKFVIAGPPRGKGAPRATVGHNGRAMMNTDTKTRKEMDLVRRLAVEAMAGRRPFTGPVSIKIVVYLAVPKSWSKYEREMALSGRWVPVAKPDGDNIQKLLADAIHPPPPPRRKAHEIDQVFDARVRAWEKIKVVIVDDKQIAEWHGWKRYSDNPRVVVEVTELRPEA